MPFPPTPSNTASNTPTPSITASNTPTVTPTGTVCPGATPTITPTISVTPSITASPTRTPNETPTQTPSQTQTQTPTKTIGFTPTQTQTQTPTSTSPECTCFTSATVNVIVAGNITFNDCDGNPTIENFTEGNGQIYGDGTFCIRKDTNAGTAEYTIVSYNTCCDLPPTPTPTQTQTPSPSGEAETCTVWRIENNTFFDVNWSGIICGTETSTGGLILVGQTIFTGCIKDGTLGYTGTPSITVSAIC